MYQQFSLVKVETLAKEKKIIVEMNMDVDPDSVTHDSIRIYCQDSDSNTTDLNLADCDILVNGKTIELLLKEWPLSNVEYIFEIKDIKNIIGEVLYAPLKRKIVFENEIFSKINIISPVEHEEIASTLVNVVWEEIQTNPDAEPVNSYYLELAKDNAFYEIVHEITIQDQQSIQLPLTEPGQYYIRIRAENSEGHGVWSDIITFYIISESSEPEENEDDEPIFEKELEIIDTPAMGVTPTSFIIQFNDEIDVDSIGEIIVIRRDY